MVEGVDYWGILFATRLYRLRRKRAFLGFTGPRSLDWSVNIVFPMPMPISMPKPMHIAERNCLFRDLRDLRDFLGLLH